MYGRYTPSMAPGYWEQGVDPKTGKFGIPAAKHPDWKPAVKRCKELSAESDRRRNAQVEAMFAITRDPNLPEDKDERAAEVERRQREVLDDPQYSSRDLYREMRALCAPAVATNLYRMQYVGSLAIRYDRVGKQAWEAELKRLGRK